MRFHHVFICKNDFVTNLFADVVVNSVTVILQSAKVNLCPQYDQLVYLELCFP